MIMTHFVERFHEDVIGQQRHQAKRGGEAKGHGTMDMTQTRN